MDSQDALRTAVLGSSVPILAALNESGVNYTNSTMDTDGGVWKIHSMAHLILTSILLGLIILSTIIGNCFVIAAVILERNLQGMANYLIVSLAVADLMVASLVMPLSAVYEVSQGWYLGPELCDLFVCMDVLCCTSSILHLVWIAMDRYWAVTRLDYMRTRTASRMLAMIGLSWVFSISISLPPLFGWKEPQDNAELTGHCLISQDWGYTVFSTVGAFYLPLVLILGIYVKIFQTAKSRIRKTKFRKKKTVLKPTVLQKEDLMLVSNDCHKVSTICCDEYSEYPSEYHVDINVNSCTEYPRETDPCLDQPTDNNDHKDSTKITSISKGNGLNNTEVVHSNSKLPLSKSRRVKSHAEKEKDRKQKIEAKRERKAARTLAIITGCFVICWLPFFLVAIVRPFCGEACFFPDLLISVLTWLGYLNSLLNPVIYTIFNPDFREAFRKILYGRYHRRRRIK